MKPTIYKKTRIWLSRRGSKQIFISKILHFTPAEEQNHWKNKTFWIENNKAHFQTHITDDQTTNYYVLLRTSATKKKENAANK